MSSDPTPVSWTRLTVAVPAEAEDPVTAAFLREDAAARATGLVVEDASVGVLALDGAAPPEGEVRVSIYVGPAEADAVAATLRARFAMLVELGVLEALPTIESHPVDAADWRDRWKEFFHVTPVSERVIVRPPWREYTPRPGEVVLEIEPGMAFGTGGHQTTQLCLRALDRVLPTAAGAPAEALDVGCGSGVLAIGAVLLGVRHAIALDVDPLAHEATGDNARRNGVAGAVEVFEGALEELVGVRTFPLVLANIISGTLLSLRDALLAVTGPGGLLVLSGLLADEESVFRAAFEADGLVLVDREVMDEWLALVYRRP